MRSVLSSKNAVEALCSNAEVIKSLNETKQYTLMATGLLEFVITDPKLTAAAAKLWEYLYSKAIMNDEISIKIRYKDLADKFSRSERTIKRHVEDLKENGYLYVQNNFNYRGQRANTFYLQIPQRIIDSLKNTKDRKKNTQEESILNKPISKQSKLESTIPNIYLSYISPTLTSEKDSDKAILNELEDKNVTPSHDTNVTLNNNIKKDILLINNNNVVMTFHDMEKAQSVSHQKTNSMFSTLQNDDAFVLHGTSENIQDNSEENEQQEINEIEKNVNQLYVQMGNSIGEKKIAILSEIQKLQANQSRINILINKKKQAREFKSIQSTTKFVQNIDPTINFNEMIGERKLSIPDIARIRKFIEKSTYHNDSDKVCNEIIYAIRFGALRTAQNGIFLTIAHAISIALKLIREKRWETPAPIKIQEKITSAFLNHDREIYRHIPQTKKHQIRIF